MTSNNESDITTSDGITKETATLPDNTAIGGSEVGMTASAISTDAYLRGCHLSIFSDESKSGTSSSCSGLEPLMELDEDKNDDEVGDDDNRKADAAREILLEKIHQRSQRGTQTVGSLGVVESDRSDRDVASVLEDTSPLQLPVSSSSATDVASVSSQSSTLNEVILSTPEPAVSSESNKSNVVEVFDKTPGTPDRLRRNSRQQSSLRAMLDETSSTSKHNIYESDNANTSHNSSTSNISTKATDKEIELATEQQLLLQGDNNDNLSDTIDETNKLNNETTFDSCENSILQSVISSSTKSKSCFTMSTRRTKVALLSSIFCVVMLLVVIGLLLAGLLGGKHGKNNNNNIQTHDVHDDLPKFEENFRIGVEGGEKLGSDFPKRVNVDSPSASSTADVSTSASTSTNSPPMTVPITAPISAPTNAPVVAPSSPPTVAVPPKNFSKYADIVKTVLLESGAVASSESLSPSVGTLEYVAYEWLVQIPSYLDEILASHFTGIDVATMSKIDDSTVTNKIIQRYTLALLDLSMHSASSSPTNSVTNTSSSTNTDITTVVTNATTSNITNTSTSSGSNTGLDNSNATFGSVTLSLIQSLVSNLNSNTEPTDVVDGPHRRQLLRANKNAMSRSMSTILPSTDVMKFANNFFDECRWTGVTCTTVNAPNSTNTDNTDDSNGQNQGDDYYDDGVSNTESPSASPSSASGMSDSVVTKLVWANSGLTGEIPSALSNLPYLTYLDLGENDLTGSIPSAIYEMTQLENLFLHQNRLTGSLSSAIGNLDNLVKLFLNSNKLSGTIPPQIGGGITNTTGKAKPLRYLNLFNNSFHGPLPTNLYLTWLFYLDFGYNQLTGVIPDDWVAGQASLQRVRNFYLDHNLLSGDLPSYFPMLGLGRFTDVRLNDNNFTGKYLFETSSTNNKLNALQLQNTQIEYISKNICSMSVLNNGELVFIDANCGVCQCDDVCIRKCN